MRGMVRLYVEHELAAGQHVPLSRDQAHYLFGVMRLVAGGELCVFNGRDGEWKAQVSEAGKRAGTLVCQIQTRPLDMPPDLWLLFAPIKKARTDFIVEKAVEMGARRIVPIVTQFTNSERVRIDRLQAHAIEAAEQCGATFVPEVVDARKFAAVMSDWDASRTICFCDEALAGEASGLAAMPSGPSAILVGPEGGFSDAERQQLVGMDCTQAISLGPRILRADTAAVAALALWQTACGDWS